MAAIFIKSFPGLRIIVFLLIIFIIWTFVPNGQREGFAPANNRLKADQNLANVKTKSLDSEFIETLSKEKTMHSSHCTIPHPGHPLIQYALVIDAGSTGSRIHVFKFNYCKSTLELEDEVFAHIEPGLSAYADHPEDAARSLDELLKVALKNVPKELHYCTPVAVKATAGLRLLGAKKSERILKAVRKHLKKKYPFPIEKDGVVIMDGKDEGIYGWITVNYLLKKFGLSKKLSTVATLDLGGGSTQIVFEPEITDDFVLPPGEHSYELQYGGHKYILYQHSYLHYGLIEARREIKNFTAKLWHESIVDNKKHKKHHKHPIPQPCLPINYTESWPTYFDDSAKLVGTGGGHAQCRFIAEKILNKNTECSLLPCSFNGIYQPSLAETFTTHDIYAFSYFYDRISPLGMPSEFTLKELRDLTDRVCSGDYNRFSHLPEAMSELQNDPHYCMDLTFIYELLHTGYEMPLEREIKIAKQIIGMEAGWCVGAAIAILDQNFRCEEIQHIYLSEVDVFD